MPISSTVLFISVTGGLSLDPSIKFQRLLPISLFRLSLIHWHADAWEQSNGICYFASAVLLDFPVLAFVAENCNLVYTFWSYGYLCSEYLTFRGHHLLETHSGNLRKDCRICLGVSEWIVPLFLLAIWVLSLELIVSPYNIWVPRHNKTASPRSP